MGGGEECEEATGATGAGNHEGRAAVRHSKRPEPELNTEDAPADSTQAGNNHQKQAVGQRKLAPRAQQRWQGTDSALFPLFFVGVRAHALRQGVTTLRVRLRMPPGTAHAGTGAFPPR